jgi:FlaG/FlaF family flagellin (archaellin)
MFRFRSSKLFVVVLAVLVFATAAYAFAAANTVPASYAGEGSAAISGYTVSNIVYTYDTANPSNVSDVDFDLNAAASNVDVSLTAAGTLQGCTNTGGNSWNCPITGVTVTSASTLRVVASQ